MFLVTEADASAIRDVFEQAGELSAAVELRRRFPLLANNANALEWARTIAGWRPVPATPYPDSSNAGTKRLGQHGPIVHRP
jgi:hypothetical protein